jgi:divalent metal cation (Fe/Co/Zn/Cd) transporter
LIDTFAEQYYLFSVQNIGTDGTVIIMDNARLYKFALYLALFTIFYNIPEGLISIFFGVTDESFTLLGFGLDSFAEVLSGVGIAHMILRSGSNPDIDRDNFERNALRVTGVSFYILTAGLVFTGIYNFVTAHKPETTVWGIVISLVSIAVMLLLVYGKKKVGRKLSSAAILADAECTKVCIYMSVILLVSSVAYELLKIPYIDALGTLGLAFYSFREGRECFEKVKTGNLCSCDINR